MDKNMEEILRLLASSSNPGEVIKEFRLLVKDMGQRERDERTNLLQTIS